MLDGSEEGQDAFYEVAGRILASRPHYTLPSPEQVRAVLESGEDLPRESLRDASGGLIHLTAAIGLGGQEVGSGAFAEAFAATGLLGLSAQDWEQMLAAAERGEGPPVDWNLLDRNFDPRGRAERANYDELVRARTVLIGLRPFYAMYFLHALLMPNTPALAAVRARIDERGVGPLLIGLVSVDPSPTEFAAQLVSCLDEMWHELYQALTNQVLDDPDLFCLPGSDTRATGFMETWTRTLQEQAGVAPGLAETDVESQVP